MTTATQIIPERFGVMVFGSRVTTKSQYLFGRPHKYDVSKPSHPNWGGLSRSWHNSQAWDIFVEENTPVYSLIDGYVFSTRFRENRKTVWGHNVVVENCDEKLFYTHLDEVVVCPGDSVKQGQLIGYVGKWPSQYKLPDGSSMPTHLHLAIYRNKLDDYLNENLQMIMKTIEPI